ncbi:RNA polymerase II mediator complex subunit [Didymella pomorum]|uniref:Mediator of RNA polymerase II transcription subunit 17 n=1 Tax=Didymella pomorum TaxID=749634 RepID=A0A9W8ZQ00_9PLEO|nr:RNA polymerase II mediator complex subunit [Didymella pomorum]
MSGLDSLKDVALRPWPADEEDESSKDVMFRKIEQLATERGHMRNITEQSLQAEIGAGKDALDDAKDGEEDGEEDTKSKTFEERRDEIMKMQWEMAMHLDFARFAAGNALDLVSLVLSADPNKRTPSSFSQVFRAEGLDKGFAFGTMGVAKENHEHDIVKPAELERRAEQQKKRDLVAKAARLEALDTATDEILEAAKNLEQEVRKETKYWQEIVSISDKGWPIHRMRAQRQPAPFAVRYGFPEANPHFKARGSAPLRMDKDGGIILDPNLAIKPKTLRIRITENGKVTGSSQLPVESAGEGLAVEKSIRLARDSLLEEELFYEMSLETRQLLPYGVRLRDSIITVDAPSTSTSTRQLLIDCIPREDRIPDGQDHTYDWLAQAITEALRLLMTHEHSMRLYRRTQLPPPLTSRKQEKKTSPLLRTLLAMLHHLQNVDSLFAYLDKVSNTLGSAGLETPVKTSREESLSKLRDSLATSNHKDLSASDQLLDMFTRPYTGKATVTLPASPGSPTEELTVAIRTVIGAPTFGTEYKLTLPSSVATDLGLSTENKFQITADIVSYLDWVLSLHVAHRVLKGEYANRAATKGTEARVTIASKNSKKGPSTKRNITVDLTEGLLALHLSNTDESSQESHSWSGQRDEITLKEKVQGWVE